MFKEIRIHGRGGQGAVTSSQVLAIAAFNDGLYSQAFPWFGVERSGAPVQSFVRISDREVMTRQFVYQPDYVMVLDSTLMETVKVAKGIKENGVLIINSNKSAEELGFRGKENFKVVTIDITKDALDIIGKPFVNIAGLGAFCSITGLVTLKSLEKAIERRFEGKGKIAEKNKAAAKKVFEDCEKVKCNKCE